MRLMYKKYDASNVSDVSINQMNHLIVHCNNMLFKQLVKNLLVSKGNSSRHCITRSAQSRVSF